MAGKFPRSPFLDSFRVADHPGVIAWWPVRSAECCHFCGCCVLLALRITGEVGVLADEQEATHAPRRTRPHLLCYGVMRRREFLTLSAASIGGVLVYSLDREVSRLSAQANQSIRI